MEGYGGSGVYEPDDDWSEFFPCVVGADDHGDTEIIMQDCFMVWEKWDERTEIAKTPEGLLVGVRLIGCNRQEQ